MNFNKYIAIMAASTLILSSCKDEKKVEPPTNTKAGLALHFEHKIGASDFELNKDFVLGTGETVNLSFVKFYISGVTLMDDNGGANTLNKYLLVDQSTHHIDVANFDPQHVHMVRFNVGVDSASNHLDPTTYDASHALAPQSPTMHWAWASGYIFFKLEGTVDADSDGTVDDTFEYHIGLDQFLRQVTGMQHKDVEAGEELTVDVKIDYAKFFDGLDLTLELSAHGMDDPALSKRIADNVEKAFTIE